MLHALKVIVPQENAIMLSMSYRNRLDEPSYDRKPADTTYKLDAAKNSSISFFLVQGKT